MYNSFICDKKVYVTFRNDLLTAVAKELDCKFVFTPQLSADIASQILTNVSLGRGLHIPFDTVKTDNKTSFIINNICFFRVSVTQGIQM